MSNSVFMLQKAIYGFKFGDTAGYECVSNVPIMLHAIPFNLSSKEPKKNCPVKSFYKDVLSEDTCFHPNIRRMNGLMNKITLF